MAPSRKRRSYTAWTPADLKTLKKHSRERTPVPKLAKLPKRTAGTVGQKAFSLGMKVGHRGRRAA